MYICTITFSATHRLLHVMATVNNVTVTPIGHFFQCSNVSRVKLTPMIRLYWAFHLIWNLVSPLTSALCLCAQLLSHVWLFATPWTTVHEAPLSMGFQARTQISQLQSLSALILEPKKIKSVTTFIFYLSICHEVIGPDAMISDFWMLSFLVVFFFF